MTELPRDIHGRSIPAFFNIPGGGGVQPINNDSPTNTAVYVDLLTATQTLPGVPMIVHVWSDIAIRIALVPAGTVMTDMSDEWVVPPNTYWPLPVLYPSRARLYVAALDADESGVLHVAGSTEGATLGSVPAIAADVMSFDAEVMHFNNMQMVWTP